MYRQLQLLYKKRTDIQHVQHNNYKIHRYINQQSSCSMSVRQREHAQRQAEMEPESQRTKDKRESTLIEACHSGTIQE